MTSNIAKKRYKQTDFLKYSHLAQLALGEKKGDNNLLEKSNCKVKNVAKRTYTEFPILQLKLFCN